MIARPRLYKRLSLAALALFSVGIWTRDVAAEPLRFTDAEKRAFARGDREPPMVVVEHPLVARSTIESKKFTPNALGGPAQLRGWIVLDLLIHDPLEEAQVDEIAGAARSAAGSYDSVGVRFTLSTDDTPRDPEAPVPSYSWRLYKDDTVDVRYSAGVSPRAVVAQLEGLALSEGERLEGIWVDYNFTNGGIAIIQDANGSTTAAYLIDPTARYVLPALPRAGGSLVKATSKVSELGSYKADGDEGDEFALRIRKDGKLLVYEGNGVRKNLPWLVAVPWRSERVPKALR